MIVTHHCRARTCRRAFTLAEMMIVIVIVLLLAGMVLPAALQIAAGDRLKDAAGTVQMMIASARDRAIAMGVPVGIRLLPEQGDRSTVRSLVYVTPAAPLTDGSAMLMYTYVDPTSGTVSTGKSWPNTTTLTTSDLEGLVFDRVVMIGVDPVRLLRLPSDIYTWPSGASVTAGPVKTYFGSIRFGKAGKLVSFKTTDQFLNHSSGYPILLLDQPQTMLGQFASTVDLTADPSSSTTAPPCHKAYYTIARGFDPPNQFPVTAGIEYSINLGAVPLEDSQPVTLPSGTIIDLGYLPTDPTLPIDPPSQRLSCVRPDGAGNWDILIAPSGRVIGAGAADPQIVLWLRDQLAGVDDVSVGTTVTNSGMQRLVNTSSPGRHALVALMGRTGLVLCCDVNFDALPAVAGYTPPSTTVTYSSRTYYNPAICYANVLKGMSSGL